MNSVSSITGYSNCNAGYVSRLQGHQVSSVGNKFANKAQADSVSFSGKMSEKDLNGDMNIKVSNGFLGMGNRKIKGTICDKAVYLKLRTGLFTDNVILTGTIDGEPVKLKMCDYKLSGDIPNEHKDVLPYIKRLMVDKRNYDNQADMLALMMC